MQAAVNISGSARRRGSYVRTFTNTTAAILGVTLNVDVGACRIQLLAAPREKRCFP